MTAISNHPPKHPRPLLRAAISAEILELQAQRRASHDRFLRLTLDARIRRLLALLQRVATAAMLAVLVMPWSASARDPCSAYMDANGCLRAIQSSTNLCVEHLYKAEPTPEDVLGCVRSAMTAAGATFQLEIEKSEARK
jgi:hypothetical protein